MSQFVVTLPSGETWTPTFVQSINEDKCIGCGRCFRVCPRGVLELVGLDDEGQRRYAALKAWRAEVAREHNLPAYVVFHDATLAEMARSQPDSLAALAGISGVGAKKLEAYGREILRVLGEAS